MFLRTNRMQIWRNWEKFLPRVRDDPLWCPKVVKALYIFSKQYLPQFVPLAQRVRFWQRSRKNFDKKIIRSKCQTNEKNWHNDLHKFSFKCSLYTQIQFRQSGRSFTARNQDIFHSKSGSGETIPRLWKKEYSSNCSSG